MRAIHDAGVVGAGGAGFPTHVKTSAKVDCVIINGAECEPLLRVDQQLMRDMPRNLLKGLSMLLDAVGAKRGVIALKKKYTVAIEQLSSCITDPRIEIFKLDDFYPAGDEQVMVREVTGKSIPEAGIPLQVDCIVSNVETVLNVAASLEGQPVTDTWLTVTGRVTEPFTCQAPIGTSKREILAQAGVQKQEGLALIEGGPMMGKLVEDWDTPVTKTTKGLIVVPEDHPLVTARKAPLEVYLRQARSVCMGCARCTEMCPRNLLGHNLQPHLIMRAMAYGKADSQAIKSSLLCCECGVCEYACPMRLSPRWVNTSLKGQLVAAGIRYQGDGTEPEAAKSRDERKIPVKRLISRLALKEYDKPAPVKELANKPKKVTILLRQHIGVPCQPVVEVGDLVERGQLIGEIPEGKLGARVHASIDGVVLEQNVAQVVIQALD